MTERFSQIVHRLIRSPYLTIYQKMVYCVLISYTDHNTKTCFPSYKTIARYAGCSRRKVIQIIAELHELQLLDKKGQIDQEGRQRSNLYTLYPYTAEWEEQRQSYDSPSRNT